MTALAVISFVGAGIAFILAMISLATVSNEDLLRKSMGMIREAMNAPNWDFVAYQAVTINSLVFLFIGSLMATVIGVGYLKMKKITGRYLGTIWAIISMILSVIVGLYTSSKLPGYNSFGFTFILGMC